MGDQSPWYPENAKMMTANVSPQNEMQEEMEVEEEMKMIVEEEIDGEHILYSYH